ncbi:F-box/FBD-like domain protein, partial [Medicago truncatula]
KPSKSTCLKMTDVESDKISCLPDHLIGQILSHLTIKEAVTTSVLSSEWRNKWSTQPDLVFDSRCVSTAISKDPSVIESKFLRIVDHVLLLHSGPINKFEVSDSYRDIIIDVNAMADIDRWIRHLTGRHIKEFVLDICFDQRYKIPSSLFSCQGLHHLDLNYCWLKPPTKFEGFRSMKILYLNRVTMSQDAFNNMIYGCPVLEKLTLAKIDGLTHINIHAPNLKFFEVDDEFESINFDNTFQLANVFIYMKSKSNQGRLHGFSSNLANFFDHLPRIQSLQIADGFLKYLATGIVPEKLPTLCVNLRSICLWINFNDLKQVSVVLCLLKSSPNLRDLRMIVQRDELTAHLTPASYCWKDIFSDPSMPLGVQHVSIGISGIKSELDFIRFLLLHSPMLEKVIVEPDVEIRSEVMTELLQLKKMSRQAEVIYCGKDSSQCFLFS